MQQQQQQLALHQAERQVSRHYLFMPVFSSTYACTICLNDLDTPGISLLLCHCAAHSTTWSVQGVA
jgi:hypothetical protein